MKGITKALGGKITKVFFIVRKINVKKSSHYISGHTF